MTATAEIKETLEPDLLLRIYETVARIRAFDDKAQALIGNAQAFFIHYPVRGHEIIAASVAAAIEPDDYMTVTYRGVADEIAKGVPLQELWAEMLGKATGTSKGRGGPMHISDPDHGLMLCTGIVGAGMPVATGLGLASALRGDGKVTIANFGDGATNIGAFHESLNMASVWSLPVVFVCQNNQYGEHTKYADTARNAPVVDRAQAYAMKGIKVDGMDPVSTYLGAKEAVEHARRGDGPVLLECVTFRTLGHVLSDQNEYMDPDLLAEQRANDPVPRFRVRLLADGVADEDAVAAIDQRAGDEVESTYEAATGEPAADPALVTGDVYGEANAAEEPGEDAEPNQRLTFREAINQAMGQALAADDRVFIMGEDVADSAGGGVFKVTSGLSTAHGEDRVRNTPISEEAIMGAGVGSAIAGMRPLVEIMFMDFLGVAFDQLANHAAKLRYMSGGRTPVPLTVRVNMVGGTPIGAQHSQSLEALLMHTPGLKVVFPSTPYDAKGLLLACIQDEDPCVFIESTGLFMKRGMVPEAAYTIPIGKAAVRREGTDVTIISYGRLMNDALKAADALAEDGVSAEVIDLRSLAPLDMDTLLASVSKTKRAVVVHEAVRTCGAGAEIATRLHEELHSELTGPVRRVTAPDGSVPAPAGLVAAFYPSADDIVAAVKGVVMTVTDAEPGLARSPGLSYQQLLDADTHEVPAILREESSRFLGDEDVPIDQYIAREWHEREKERLWSRVWQFACREEHIPRVGDHTVYDIAGRSYVIVRVADDDIKAYPNACLHRGRQLKQYDGNCSEIRCAFHGFAWNLDGSLKDVPAAWDLPHVTPEKFQLPEVQVGTWDGFVFINPDPGASPLPEYVKDLAAHFDRWNLRDRYVQAHVSKIIACNWKISSEAFCEAFHVNATHPQILPYIGDTNSQVDVWDNCSRVITPAATPSPLIDWTPDDETILRYALDVRLDEELFITVKEGQTARSAMADATRDRWRPIVGALIDEWSDAEMVDNLDYTLFPNFHPWGALNRIVYRFRPNGDDHRSSIMEVLFLAPFKGERPPPAPIHHLGVDEPWTDAQELGVLGKVFEQDTFNMARVQLGLESTHKPGVTLANYQESKVRWLHQKLEQFVNGEH